LIEVNKKNRILTLMCLLIFTVSILSGCGGANMKTVEKTLEEAKKINSNSDFGGVEYLQLSELTEEEARYYSNDQPEMACSTDMHVEGYFFHYPDKGGERRLTQIKVSGGNYNIFNIRLGDNADEAAQILKDIGYKETDPMVYTKGTTIRNFKKYDVIISLYTEAENYSINTIYISTDTHPKISRGRVL